MPPVSGRGLTEAGSQAAERTTTARRVKRAEGKLWPASVAPSPLCNTEPTESAKDTLFD